MFKSDSRNIFEVIRKSETNSSLEFAILNSSRFSICLTCRNTLDNDNQTSWIFTGCISVTRLGYFWKILVVNLLAKEAKKLATFWPIWKLSLLKFKLYIFGGNFMKNGQLFIPTFGHTGLHLCKKIASSCPLTLNT